MQKYIIIREENNAKAVEHREVKAILMGSFFVLTGL